MKYMSACFSTYINTNVLFSPPKHQRLLKLWGNQRTQVKVAKGRNQYSVMAENQKGNSSNFVTQFHQALK